MEKLILIIFLSLICGCSVSAEKGVKSNPSQVEAIDLPGGVNQDPSSSGETIIASISTNIANIGDNLTIYGTSSINSDRVGSIYILNTHLPIQEWDYSKIKIGSFNYRDNKFNYSIQIKSDYSEGSKHLELTKGSSYFIISDIGDSMSYWNTVSIN